MSTECRCESITELIGDDAHEYANKHLTKTGGDGAKWEIYYVCRETGFRWVRDYPFEGHYDSNPRLTRGERGPVSS